MIFLKESGTEGPIAKILQPGADRGSRAARPGSGFVLNSPPQGPQSLRIPFHVRWRTPCRVASLGSLRQGGAVVRGVGSRLSVESSQALAAYHFGYFWRGHVSPYASVSFTVDETLNIHPCGQLVMSP